MLLREHLGPPPDIEVQELRFTDPGYKDTVDQIIGIYKKPAVRSRLLELPRSSLDIVQGHSYGKRVFYASDTNGTLTDTPHRVVGAVSFIPREMIRTTDVQQVEIQEIAVLPDFARRGIGTKLMSHALDVIFADNTHIHDAFVRIPGDAPGWAGVASFLSMQGFIYRPEQVRAIPFRDLGPVEEWQSAPFRGAAEGDLQGIPHYFTTNVPIHVVGISRGEYQARRSGAPGQGK